MKARFFTCLSLYYLRGHLNKIRAEAVYINKEDDSDHGGQRMKKWMWISIFILLIFLLFCQKQNQEQPASIENPQEPEKISSIAQEIENNIQSAISSLAEGKVDEGANLLLDAVLLTRPSGSWPDNFENSIQEAKEQFQDMNIQKGVELISDALQLMKPAPETTKEKAKEETKEIKQVQKRDKPAPVAQLIRDKILRARKEFKEGNADKGVILLLESLLLFSPRIS